jgi:N-methylhydantoinase A
MTWRIAVDIGGTFTDLVAWRVQDDRIVRAKVLTTPDDPVSGVFEAVRRSGVELADATVFVHGSTIAINAVLQGTGARTALLTTRGFRDVLEMGRKNRPDMYNLGFRPRRCLVPRELRYEIDERMDHQGAVVEALDLDQVRAVVASLPGDIEAVAVALLHSYANPSHERSVARTVREALAGAYVTVSTDVSRELREYERTSTAVVNAYVGPAVSTYMTAMKDGLTDRGCSAPLMITQSNGGIMSVDAAVVQPVRTTESGPAAGVTGAAWLGERLGLSDLIAFDMGGTTAKACVVTNGEPAMSAEYYIGGHLTGMPVQVPFLDIVEVGAGGGSIAYAEGGGLRVGPHSAGSVPGPACYGLGGSAPTITDANLLVGRIAADRFLGGEMKLDVAAAEAAMAPLASKLQLGIAECAHGIVRVADAIMANAIRAVTIEQGRDPRDFTLVAYGGAGPVHAAALARDLGIPRVVVPSGPGTFAAFGMLVTDIRHDAGRAFVANLDEIGPDDLTQEFGKVDDEVRTVLATYADEDSASEPSFMHKLDLRYAGQFHPLTMAIPSDSCAPDSIAELFHKAHLLRYGHNAPGERIEIEAIRVTGVRRVGQPATTADPPVTDPWGSRTRPVLFEDGGWMECKVVSRIGLAEGSTVDGPAIIEDPATSIVVGPRDRAAVLADGHVLVTIDTA